MFISLILELKSLFNFFPRIPNISNEFQRIMRYQIPSENPPYQKTQLNLQTLTGFMLFFNHFQKTALLTIQTLQIIISLHRYNQMQVQVGSIEVIYGPMFSGKSTELLRTVRRFGYAKKKCLVINYSFDNRYSQQEVMSTHDKQMCSAVKCVKLQDIRNTYQNYDAIAIDQGQFFPDIVEMCEQMANNGKTVIVSGLDGTFERKPFGNILQLVALAEKVTKLNSICAYCYSLASFTHRTVKSKEVELIGGQETYKPVCRKCYFDKQGDSTNSSSSNSPKSCKNDLNTVEEN